MSTYWREALIAGCVTSSIAALVAAATVAAGANMVGGVFDQAVARVLMFFFAFAIAQFTTLPASLPVALVVPRLRVWSVASVALLVWLVVLTSSVTSFVTDPLSLREKQSLSAYFWAGKWAFCLFNALGIVSGSIGAFAAFEFIRRERVKKLRPSLPTAANSHTMR